MRLPDGWTGEGIAFGAFYLIIFIIIIYFHIWSKHHPIPPAPPEPKCIESHIEKVPEYIWLRGYWSLWPKKVVTGTFKEKTVCDKYEDK